VKAIYVGRWGSEVIYVDMYIGEGYIWWGGEDEVFKWDGSEGDICR